MYQMLTPPKEPLKVHHVPSQPQEQIVMGQFDLNGHLYLLVCDYFSKFLFTFQIKMTTFQFSGDKLKELSALSNGKEFASSLLGLGIKHNINPQSSNGFIEKQVHTMNRPLTQRVVAKKPLQV